jgi:hypothetical protein
MISNNFENKNIVKCPYLNWYPKMWFRDNWVVNTLHKNTFKQLRRSLSNTNLDLDVNQPLKSTLIRVRFPKTWLNMKKIHDGSYFWIQDWKWLNVEYQVEIFKNYRLKWYSKSWLSMVLAVDFITFIILKLDFFSYSLNSLSTWGHHHKTL